MDTDSPPPPPRRGRRVVAVALAAVVVGLLLTAQERTLGAITDEQQVLGTAVALVETGELGLPRGFAFAVPQDRGDALSPYGLGMSLAFLPAAALAPRWERWFGAGASQSLLVLVPLALVALAAAGAASLAASMGASPEGAALAAVGTALASPLWPLGSTAFSEPLQAAAMALAAASAAGAALTGRPGRERALASAAGALVGVAVLAKSMNLVVAPWCLAPLAFPGPWRARATRLGAAALGAMPLGIAWAALETARFGRPLASYAGQPFSHPPLDGLWRLTVGPNEGLLLYFPLGLASLLGLGALAARRNAAGPTLAVAGPTVTTFALVAAWWAWDGSAGWGPRLVTPTIPLLAACAGAWARSRRRLVAAGALVLAGAAVNALGVLQPEPATLLYVDSCGPAPVPDDDVDRWPAGLAETFPAGERRVSQSMVAVTRPAFSPLRIHARLLAVRWRPGTPESRLSELEGHPPWQAEWPQLRPRPRGTPGQLDGVLFSQLVQPLRWPHWGACLRADPVSRRTGFVRAWLDAFDDQVLRALDLGRWERACALAERYFQVARHDRAAALWAESLRAAGRADDLERLLQALPDRTRATPELQAVLALRARDRGDEAEARRVLEELAAAGTAPGAARALALPLDRWPRTARPVLSSDAPWR